MKFSLCISTYNRPEWVMESFRQVLYDPRIDDIVILDDCSEADNFQKVFEAVKDMPHVELYHNAINIGMGATKRKVVSFAKNPWVILFDDDNIIAPNYLDAIEAQGILNPETYYLPDFLMPHFNLTQYAWDYIDRSNIRDILSSQDGQALMNACNMVVQRDRYLSDYAAPEVESASDTLWQGYNHLKNGGNFFVVPNMRYFHRVHDGSGFLKDLGNSLAQAGTIREKIFAL